VNDNSAKLRLLVHELGRMPPDIRSGLRSGFRKAGQIVLRDARSAAAWSRRIPAAMSLGTSTTAMAAGVVLRVDANKAPHARPYEGISGRGDTFRHPVFGNRESWVTQATRPFLAPAAARGRDQVAAASQHAVRTAAMRAGFR
jgi:hypothetical protein